MTYTIGTIMVVAGDQKYFDYASISIPSFLRTNGKATALFVVTDRFEEIRVYQSLGNLKVIQYANAIPPIAEINAELIAKQHRPTYPRSTWNIQTKFFNVIPPMAQHILGANFTHILKVDCDSFFTGDIITPLRAEIESGYGLYLVERKDPRMVVRDMLLPGVGFYMWPTANPDGGFAALYRQCFVRIEQKTINTLHAGSIELIKTKQLTNPAFHVIYPFKKNPKFTKADAEAFGPAYFHLDGLNTDVYQNQLKMERWFNE